MTTFKKLIYLTTLVVTVTLAASAPAATPLSAPLGPEEAREAMERIREMHASVESISASVSQVKRSPLVEEDMVTSGTLVLKKPNLLYWEVRSPERTVIVVDGRTMWVYVPAIEEVRKKDLRADARARRAMGFFSSSIDLSGGDLSDGEFSGSFDVTLYDVDERWAVVLVPKSRIARRYLKSLRVWYRKSDGVPVGFDVIGRKGDETETLLTAISVNPEVDSALFEFDPPDGVRVVDEDLDDGDEW